MKLLGYLWALPHTLVGLLLGLTIFRAKGWRWSEGAIEAISSHLPGNPGAQTQGWVIYYRDHASRGRADLRLHERVHVRQAMVLGPFFPIAYAAHFLYLWARSGFGPWHDAYMQIWAERQAYKEQDEHKRESH